ncbi:MAG: hypothetical protein ACFC1C_03865 [Candidatus Malihini olakiniferum]
MSIAIVCLLFDGENRVRASGRAGLYPTDSAEIYLCKALLLLLENDLGEDDEINANDEIKRDDYRIACSANTSALQAMRSMIRIPTNRGLDERNEQALWFCLR